ncbi:uncharacterized protein LOC129227835 [Uloborus diversus]|uniref:uncharacterized protein LOC129227835 n=1 Tax=Uloborus diversus TaxID=327109 RepID=UPI002409075F|nr:uncharacterized protein LOC129227835 [Uloborus diversus]
MLKVILQSIFILSIIQIISSEEPFCDNKCYGQGVVTSRSCHCDRACSLVYNDCCGDSEHFVLGRNATKGVRSLMCKRNVLVVNSCLKEWNGPDFIVNSCKLDSNFELDPVGNAPVTSESTGITYSNYYCAICNGDAENIIMWNIKMSCPLLNPDLPENKDEAFKYIFYNHPTNEWGYVLNDTNTKKMTFHGCAVTSEIPDPHGTRVRQCDESVKTCATTWKKDAMHTLCNGYMDPVYYNGTKYKNFYCAICNKIDQSKLSCGEAMGPRTNAQPESDDLNKMSFSLLLDINFSEGNSVGKRPATGNCRTGEIFDPFARRCRNIVCGIPGYVLQNGLCMSEADLPV